MALIKCSECGKEVSDKANACPSCGNPINNAPTPPIGQDTTPKPVEIELTSKKWKKVHLLSWAVLILGFVLMANDPQHQLGFWGGVNLVLLAIIIRFVGKIGAWWSNR